MPERLRPVQKDMFTDEWVDNRTKRQKKRDAAREAPQQPFMFSQREMAQFGVNSHPRFPLSPHTSLRLLYPDYRTPAEVEADREREAQSRTARMFEEETNPQSETSHPARGAVQPAAPLSDKEA
ncbi:MAG: hypothetical protein L0154_13640 [Chloroflexi bacterium]|nr:hypothetical protein [Chloroflexota bacterium]